MILKFSKKTLTHQFGFTLVESMVVVAIIGILSSIAIPSIKRYQAKSKTTEAKLQLALTYSSETVFNSEYNVYASCLGSMGYDPSVEALQRYYGIGIDATFGEAESYSNGGESCSMGASRFASGKISNGISSVTVGSIVGGGGTTGSFTVVAIGNIMPDGGTDVWTINDSKVIKNIRVGY